MQDLGQLFGSLVFQASPLLDSLLGLLDQAVSLGQVLERSDLLAVAIMVIARLSVSARPALDRHLDGRRGSVVLFL